MQCTYVCISCVHVCVYCVYTKVYVCVSSCVYYVYTFYIRMLVFMSSCACIVCVRAFTRVYVWVLETSYHRSGIREILTNT